MGAHTGADLDAWVRNGGIVVAASDRARRALLAGYHRARRAEGLAAWNTPPIYDWTAFAREQWDARNTDGRLVLNTLQEQALWARIVAELNPAAALLSAPLRRLASMAMDAHGLLCSHAPRYLDRRAREVWRQDAGAFSRWLAAFDDACRKSEVVSINRLPLELIPLLEADRDARPPLLLAGFDRVLPVQKQLFDAWGVWHSREPGPQAERIRSYAALDAKSELDACAQWCRQCIESRPGARILVVTQETSLRRGEIERVFLRHSAANSDFRFEFSLGVPLHQIAVVRGAQLLLHWIDSGLTENEIDWLFSTPYAAASAREFAALHGAIRELRRRSLQRTHWTLDAFLRQRPVRVETLSPWAMRMTNAQQRLAEVKDRKQSPLEWAALVPQLLEIAGWLGRSALVSVEYQATQRLQQVVDTCGSLGYDGVRIGWRDFFSELTDALAQTLFTPQSEDAPILIAGPAESAGLNADAIWFLGAHEDAWPARGALHPLLPAEVQREFLMPHSTPQVDFELARVITERLTASAAEIHFSYARQSEGVEARPSRLVEHVAGIPTEMPREWRVAENPSPLTIDVEDWSKVPFSAIEVQGGSSVLTAQSQCPFKAFATARLGAQSWEAAAPALTPAQRGQLLHAVLHAVWAGPPNGIRSLDDLHAIADNRSFVAKHAARVMAEQLPPGVREQMPARYFALEERRLTRLATAWLEYEAARLPFTVAETEAEATTNIAGLTLKLRLDRVDRLNDNTMLVIDYKTGDVSPKSWNLPRPDDVQLPLYANFGLSEEQLIGGLVFARLRAGEVAFAGCVGDAGATLGGVENATSLKRNPLTAEMLIAWRDAIEQLARDFVAGRAEVDPRDPPRTCAHCGLQSLCRIQERAAITDDNTTEENGDA